MLIHVFSLAVHRDPEFPVFLCRDDIGPWPITLLVSSLCISVENKLGLNEYLVFSHGVFVYGGCIFSINKEVSDLSKLI